jgi:hypothetical protein
MVGHNKKKPELYVIVYPRMLHKLHINKLVYYSLRFYLIIKFVS